MYENQINLGYLLFLRPILTDVQKVNKAFEAKDADQTKLLKDLMTLLSSLVEKVVIPTEQIDVLTCRLEDHLNPKPYLGYLFETYVDNMKAQKTDEFSVADEAVMRESCIRFITTLVDEIRQRLPDNITVLQKTSLLSVENALCVVKEPLIPLLEAMAVPPETIEKIQNQWGKITLLDWKQISSTQSFWCEVHSYKDACGENPFAELAGFAMSMLVLPYSNAEVERTFSQLNIVKSKLRNKLKPETTNAILVVRAGLKRHQKSCFDYELPAAVVSAIGTSATYVQPSHLSGPSTSTSGPVEMVSDDNSGDEDLDVFFVDL